MSETERGLGGYVVVALITAGVVYSCTSEGNERSAAIPPPAPVMLTPTVAPSPTIAKVMQSPKPEAQPVHLYESAEGATYYYSAAVTEEQRKTGKVAPDMIAFWYLGRDDAGRDRIQRVIKGAGGLIAKCARPCKVIHYSDGSTVGFNEQSIIGGAFVDAQRGFLKRKPLPAPVATPTSWPGTQINQEADEGSPESGI